MTPNSDTSTAEMSPYHKENLSQSTINPLNPKSNKHLISPYNITPESLIKVMRIKEMIMNKRSFWSINKFSLSAPKKCIENSMENMHADLRV